MRSQKAGFMPQSQFAITALVPMRHHSERVPGKNYRPFAGRPLYAHILTTLQQIPDIDAIVVDTDSPVILQGLAEDFPDVIRLERPEHLRGGMVPMNDILLYDTQQVESSFYLQTHSTNPLIKPATIKHALDAFLKAHPQHDALFSVTRFQTRLWDEEGKPVNHDPTELIRTQDLPPLYVENSCLYVFERDAFHRTGNRLCTNPTMWEIDAIEAIDIDEEVDFTMAECIASSEW